MGHNTCICARHLLPTFHSADALDTIPDLHVVAFEGHEDSAGVVGLALGIHLGVAVRELEAVVAVVLHHLAVHLEILLHPAEGQVDVAALPSALDGGVIVNEAVNLLVLHSSHHGRGLGRLRRLLLLQQQTAAVPLGAGGGLRPGQEAQRLVAGAFVPKQDGDEREQGADHD